MLRRLSTLVSAVSLALCAATCVLWGLGLRAYGPSVEWIAVDPDDFFICAFRVTAVTSGFRFDHDHATTPNRTARGREF